MRNMSTEREVERSSTTQSEDDKTREVRTTLSGQDHSIAMRLIKSILLGSEGCT